MTTPPTPRTPEEWAQIANMIAVVMNENGRVGIHNRKLAELFENAIEQGRQAGRKEGQAKKGEARRVNFMKGYDEGVQAGLRQGWAEGYEDLSEYYENIEKQLLAGFSWTGGKVEPPTNRYAPPTT